MASEEEIAGILARGLPPEESCRALVDLANDHGGGDNITAVVASFGPQAS
jgi:serine/threonine protein phosphatase PrpC